MPLPPLVDACDLENGCFYGPLLLTLCCELTRCQVAKRAVRSMLIVVDALGFDLRPRIVDRFELVDVQKLVSQFTVEALDVAVFCGFSGRMKSRVPVHLRVGTVDCAV